MKASSFVIAFILMLSITTGFAQEKSKKEL